MGFFSNIISATVKTIASPLAVVKDVANVASGERANTTKGLFKSVAGDVGEALNNLVDAEL